MIMSFATICVGGPVAARLLKMPSLVGEIFAGILLGPNLGSPPAATHFPKGALKAVAKGEALAKAKAKEWRNQRHQKTDDGDAAEEEEAAAAAEEEDAIATLGADVEDLKEARDAVTATLPAQWSPSGQQGERQRSLWRRTMNSASVNAAAAPGSAEKSVATLRKDEAKGERRDVKIEGKSLTQASCPPSPPAPARLTLPPSGTQRRRWHPRRRRTWLLPPAPEGHSAGAPGARAGPGRCRCPRRWRQAR